MRSNEMDITRGMLGIYEFCFGVSFKRHDEPTEQNFLLRWTTMGPGFSFGHSYFSLLLRYGW